MRTTVWLAVACVALAVSCRRQDIRTVVISVPGMKNEKCAAIVVDALQRTQGVAPDRIKVNAEKRTVTASYDSLQRNIKNLEYCIAEAGFAANEIPANAEAVKALPPECR
jgi:copper chaperone CopZ